MSSQRNGSADRPRCPACRLGGYAQDTAPDGRPRFTCSRCGHTWTQGRSGGQWVLTAAVPQPEEPRP